MKISMFFVNFQLHQIQNCSVQIKKMKDRIFSFQLKKTTSDELYQMTMLDIKNGPPALDLTGILKSCHEKE